MLLSHAAEPNLQRYVEGIHKRFRPELARLQVEIMQLIHFYRTGDRAWCVQTLPWRHVRESNPRLLELYGRQVNH